MKWLKNRWIRALIICLGVLLLLFLFRMPIARGLGSYLIAENEQVKADAVVVLGGSSLDRGMEGYRVYNDGMAPMIICTGGNIPQVLQALDTMLYEAEITKLMLLKKGVPGSDVVALTGSTSTKEESEEVFAFAQQENLDTIMIVTSKLHLRRTSKVFTKQFEDSDVHLVFHGAPSTSFDEAEWWKSEQGLIMVNNEYMKLLYYFFKY
jgi:uncharacterized SAM-binding protein YcdF (DUF218 family)